MHIKFLARGTGSARDAADYLLGDRDATGKPLKVLCELGGWKNAQTVLRCYQKADEGQLRKALDRPRVRT